MKIKLKMFLKPRFLFNFWAYYLSLIVNLYIINVGTAI